MATHDPIPTDTESVVSAVYEAAFRVHRTLGPGLLESVYEICLCHELTKLGMQFVRQHSLPIVYDGVKLDAGLRLDIHVEGCVVVELKAVEHVSELHKAQVLIANQLQFSTTKGRYHPISTLRIRFVRRARRVVVVIHS